MQKCRGLNLYRLGYSPFSRFNFSSYQLYNEIHTESHKSYIETVLKLPYLDKERYLKGAFRFQSD